MGISIFHLGRYIVESQVLRLRSQVAIKLGYFEYHWCHPAKACRHIIIEYAVKTVGTDVGIVVANQTLTLVVLNNFMGAFCNTFDLHFMIIGLENQVSVFLRVAVFHRFLLYNVSTTS